ncbi:MAG TPA: delta-60 repeat domain-containing protein, partial [Bacteroidota bacterium]
FRMPVTQQNGSDFALARYNADGSLDLSFGSGGKVTTDFLGLADVANAVAIQPDGKIVAVGYDNVTSFALFLFDFALARYKSDGSPDASFGSGGKVTTNFFGSYDEARAVVIQPGGKLVVAGTATNPFQESISDFGLVRYNSDGSLDATFGDNGKVMTDFGSEFDDAWALAQEQDGRLVVAGQSEDSQERTDFALARYNANGELDATFGSGGLAKTDFFGFDDRVRAVALQNDGKVVAAGIANDVIEGQFQVYIALARYDGVSFDICLQDDSNGAFFQFNSMSGDYQFTNCNGVTIGGPGVISRRGSTITLQQNGSDRRVLVRIDGGVNKGTASVQLLSQRTTFTITDRNTRNNTCSCEAN